MTVAQQQEYMKMEQEQIDRFISSYHPAKFANKKNGVVSSYSANTHQGIVRNYNEDRVSIILNIIRPKFKQVDEWPRCSFFAVYDGHGGSACADFLRDQLHQLIVRDENFPGDPKLAIERGLLEAEAMFLEWAHQQSRPNDDFVERSGTCAIIVLIVGDICYVANVGDSRAIMSADGGSKILVLSKDHKPEDDDETKRIEAGGGQIYQNKSYVPDPSPDNASGLQMIIGPYRVFPGRLSVSRTIGDIEAKDARYGGNPKCVIPDPDIKAFKIRPNYDFIVLGCDGVFEKLDNKAVINGSWEANRCDFEHDEVLRKNVD
jgi:protein phosphatase 2C family protein 2/3